MQEHRPPSPATVQNNAVQDQRPSSSANIQNNADASSCKSAKNLYEPYVTPGWFWISLRAVARMIFFLFLNIKLVGLKNVPKKGPFIIACNHLSWTDIPLIPAYLSPQVVYLAKEEAFQGRLAWLVRFMGAIPVKRGEADRQLLRASDSLLKRGKILVIFPEGTRSKNGKMAHAHAGVGMIALRAGVPIVPVAICGSENTLKKVRSRITIVYGEPMLLQPKGAKITKDDITDATEAVMHRIASMLPESYRGAYGDQVEQIPRL